METHLHIRSENVLLIYGLHKLADDERHTLDALDLLLSAHQLPL